MDLEEGIIKPWGLFLLDIAKEVRDEELRDIKMILGDKLTSRDRESVSDPVDLLELLEDKGLISEDNTALLHELFVKAEYIELIPRLKQYEESRKEYLERVSMLVGRRDPLFVGRDSYIKAILDFFKEARHPGVRCVCLWGMAGTGKTKLGAETCAIYAEIKDSPKPRLVLVDLNKKNSVGDVGMGFLSSVGQPVEASKFKLELIYDWIRSCREGHVFLFDNADDLLKPTSIAKDHFQNMLIQTLKWENNSNIKIIITSRYAVNFPHLNKHHNFKEIEVQSLEMEEAVDLLFKSVPQGNLQVRGQVSITEEQAMKLSEHCGNNPQALRAVASQLRNGKEPDRVLRLLANPMKMELVLNDQSLWGLGQDATEEYARESNQVLKCLGVMFEDMNPHLQPHLIRLAVLPGLFSQTWGLKILSDIDQEGSRRQSLSDSLAWELDDVAGTSLLLRESLDIFQSEDGREASLREKFYSMHPLVRCLCLMKVEADEKMKTAFQSALLSFIDECFQLLRKFTGYDDEDACGSLQRLEKEKANITQYLELEMQKTFDEKPHPLAEYLPDYGRVLRRSNIARESNILAFMERFMFTKERSKFFRQRAEAAKKFQDLPGWVSHQGWYADQQLQLHQFRDAETAIVDPISYCQSQRMMTSDLREGYSQCLYVKGNLLVQKPQDRGHIQNKMRDEGTKILKKCIEIRDRNLGNSIVRARTINALGSAYFESMKYEEALKQHKLALEVLTAVTHNHPETHPDYTFYLMNIGTCYHELGYSFSRSITQREKGRRYFDQAIRTYKDGQTALRGVGMEKTSIMGTMLKNLAMTYCEMKEYRQALDYADQATGIRVRTLGDDHPDVARAHYFVGSLYMSLGDEMKDSGKNVFEIEEYKKARECFDRALIIELKVGYDRRSQDYADLKEDFEKLFKILNKKREWQRYSLKFKEHEKGQYVPVAELEASLSAASSEPSTSSSTPRSRLQERKRTGESVEPLSPGAPDSPPDPKKCYVS
ncbi:uncharacterized protein LOC121429449 [Lytechinus variegatus]|uniref:uncharacterized protein LOC121429449 n=1 Tax=Lytechinus variegatus TaxID=7654 RepID=UPI001BB13DD1|nr:uncharacterized protein LOC121429449 [Lytechinus variegatus]